MKNTKLNLSVLFYLIIINLLLLSNSHLNYLIDSSFMNFHEGEYLGLIWDIQDYIKNNKPFPIIIHGMMDYIPELLSYNFGKFEYIITNTRITNLLIVNITWSFFFLTLYEFIKKTNIKETLLFFIFVLFYTLANQIESPIEYSMSFLGLREFLIIILSYLTLKNILNNTFEFNYSNILIPIIFTFSLFWSYNRAPFAIVIFFFYSVFLLKNKNYNVILFNVITIITILILLENITLIGKPSEHIYNFLYFYKNGNELWHRPNLYKFSSLEYFMTFCLFILIAKTAYCILKNRDPKYIILSIQTIIINLFMFKIVSMRPGGLNSQWAFWPLILFTFLDISKSKNIQLSFLENFFLKVKNKIKTISILYIPLLILILINSKNDTRFIDNFKIVYDLIAQRKNVNSEIIHQSYTSNYNFLKNLDLTCSLGWTNDGVLALTSKLPSCGRFPYNVQIAAKYQEQVIGDLKKLNPKIIYMNSPMGVVYMDGEEQKNRLALIHDFIEKNYPFKTTINNFDLYSREPLYSNSISSGTINFNEKTLPLSFLKNGWHNPEKNYVWSKDNESEIEFHLFESNVDYNYHIKIKGNGFFVANKLSEQNVAISINGVTNQNIIFDKNNNQFVLPIPEFFISKVSHPNQIINIKFKYSNAVSPRELNVSNDSRKLAINLEHIELVKTKK